MNKTLLLRSQMAVLAAFACAFATAVSAQTKKPDPAEQAVLLGQFGDWGAYKATPGGKKICFALSKPTSGATDPAGRKRDPSYAFVSTRPAEKVKNEVSVIVVRLCGWPAGASFCSTLMLTVKSIVLATTTANCWQAAQP